MTRLEPWRTAIKQLLMTAHCYRLVPAFAVRWAFKALKLRNA